MKPAPFDYFRARTPEEAAALLADAGDEARVLAGGQSLVLDMNFRRVRPSRLVDINPVDELDRLDAEGDYLRVGALVRHRAFEEPVVPGPLGAMLARACGHIAHPPIRARGTMVGSLAYAHPAAEWGAVAVALDAELELLGPGGRRTVGAGDFFRGPFATAREPDELLTGVRLPLPDGNTGAGFVEHRRTEASYAMVAAVATLTLRGGTVDEARIGLANAADRPLRARLAERSLAGEPPSSGLFAEAGRLAAGEADPRPEPHCDVAYRRHAVSVLVRRALAEAHATVPAGEAS